MHLSVAQQDASTPCTPAAAGGMPMAALLVSVLGFLLVVLFFFTLSAKLDRLLAVVGEPGASGTQTLSARMQALEDGAQAMAAYKAEMDAKLAGLDGLEKRAVIRSGLAAVAAELRATEANLNDQDKARLQQARTLLDEAMAGVSH